MNKVITSTELRYIVQRSSGRIIELPRTKYIVQRSSGHNGQDGQAATVTVGSTTTLSPGSPATVTNAGTASAAILDFGIPRGANGPQGEMGPTGPTGPAGATGPAGPNQISDTTAIDTLTTTTTPSFILASEDDFARAVAAGQWGLLLLNTGTAIEARNVLELGDSAVLDVDVADGVAGLNSSAKLPLGTLDQGGATTNQVVQWNGSAWVAATVTAAQVTNVAAINAANTFTASQTIVGNLTVNAGDITIQNNRRINALDASGTPRRIFFIDAANNCGFRNDATSGNTFFGNENPSNGLGSIFFQLQGRNVIQVASPTDATNPGSLVLLRGTSADAFFQSQITAVLRHGWANSTTATRTGTLDIVTYSITTPQIGFRQESNAGGVRQSLYGVAPVARQTIAAGATDLASVITLANDLRAKLITLGAIQ